MDNQQSISGTITDNIGEGLSGAEVILNGNNLQEPKSTISNASGHFRFLDIPIGNYSLQATMSGFKTVKQTNIVVELGRNVHLDLVMEPISQH